MPPRNESSFELLVKFPWWVSAALGLLAFIGLRWGIPAWAGNDPSRQFFVGLSQLAPFVFALFVLAAVGAFLFARKRARLVDQQTSLDSLRMLSWKDFEFMVAEAYRRLGFEVEYSLGRGADGGVDLTLRKAGQKILVQCKQWKVFAVGAPVIREMFGLMTAERADQVIVITSGNFTSEAKVFSQDKPISLVDGPQLLQLVQSIQYRTEHSEPLSQGVPAQSSRLSNRASEGLATASTPSCPECGKPMVLRTARRGSNAGNQFWGCSTYPKCRGVKEG